MISGNMVGSYSQIGKTFILVDEDGNEITGVCVDNPVVFTAGDNDVREGMVYAGDDGVSTGTKVIPVYHTLEGTKLIMANGEMILPINGWDYTKLQCLICLYNTNLANSVETKMVVINDNIYDVQSTTSISVVVKDVNKQLINLGITNTLGKPILIRYFTYKEIY